MPGSLPVRGRSRAVPEAGGDRCGRKKGRHTTHLQGFPPAVKITRRRHPFEGQALDVLGWMHRHGALELLLVLPDGTKSLIPATWTDLDPAPAPEQAAADRLGSLGDLLHVRAVVDALIRDLPLAGHEAGTEPAKEGAHAVHAEPAEESPVPSAPVGEHNREGPIRRVED